ncbi:hypothetical protein BGZ89_001823 [Linnemannia elongata]|nr:hypothetical protein BGZ89_001823 [Linnemannia elongata]
MPAGPRLPLPAFTDQLCFYYRVDFNNLPPLAATITPQVPRDSHKHPLYIHQNPNLPNDLASRSRPPCHLSGSVTRQRTALCPPGPESDSSCQASLSHLVSSRTRSNTSYIGRLSQQGLIYRNCDLGHGRSSNVYPQAGYWDPRRTRRQCILPDSEGDPGAGSRQHVVDAVVNNGLRHLIKVVWVGVGATFGSVPLKKAFLATSPCEIFPWPTDLGLLQ